MKWMTRLGAVLTVMLGVFGSCLGPGSDPAPDGAVGTRMAFWSEDRFDRADVAAAAPDDSVALLTDQVEFDAWLDTVAPDLAPGVVTGIDMDTHVVLVGSYARCVSHGMVQGTETGRESVLTFRVLKHEDVECVWAPLTVEVWSIPRADLAGVPVLGPVD